MGNKTLVYKQKLEQSLTDSAKHLKRLDDAFGQLMLQYELPLKSEDYHQVIERLDALAYCDQIIYRFSKLQDTMGAKLFKALLLYQGENIDKPFLDLLNRLERMEIINVDEWFEIRDLRNEISHEYEENERVAVEILNTIYRLKDELKAVLDRIEKVVKRENI